MGADFSGYVTKANLKCTDGRTIMPDAFKHQDKMRVPLVWQHGHRDVNNVMGHVDLEARPDGVYGYGYFNDTPQGKNGKIVVQHDDVNSLSIWANQLVERAKQVFHGMIKEVSLVLAGANPGAKIDFVALEHSDGTTEDLTDEAIITTGLPLEHEDKPAAPPAEEKPAEEQQTEQVEHSADDPTVQEVYDSLTDEQKDVVHYMIGTALAEAKAGSSSSTQHADDKKPEGDLEHKEGTTVTNVFEQNKGAGAATGDQHVLSHDDMKGIFASAVKIGSLKAAVEEYALAHGIDNIETLFPPPKAVDAVPDFDKRRTEWVAGVINGAHKSPFSRIKNFWADLRFDDARAKGYIKGSLKKEEFFAVSQRTTAPTTVYKKQKLDRDDILDITDFDTVAWMKGEMRLMLEEEIARAMLIGDGRDPGDDDKIKDPVGAQDGIGIRSIINDHELYAATVNVQLTGTLGAQGYGGTLVDGIISAMGDYKGTGTPTFYTTLPILTKMLLTRDTLGRRLYRTVSELASELMVTDVVAVEAMESLTATTNLIGVIVNMVDYTLGADRGGEISLFDFFDIDYNQYKYLIETRVSGALTKIRSALVIREATGDNALLPQPTAPTFVASTGVVTIPTTTNVTYKNSDTNATLSAGAQTALASGATLNVIAVANAGYAFPDNEHDQWSFTRP